MKTIFSLLALGLAVQALVAADSDAKAEIAGAARKLAGQPGYIWTSTPKVAGDGLPNYRPGPTEGRTEKGGFTHCKSSLNDTEYETAFKGDKAAIKREGDWQSADELEDNNAWIARRLKSFKAPAAEAEDLAGKAKELKKDKDGLCVGDLTEEGVKELFSRSARRSGSTVSGAKGSVKFWLKDGALAKYEFNLQGKITVGQDGGEIEINRTTTVEIKDVGKTKVELPEEARKKLISRTAE